MKSYLYREYSDEEIDEIMNSISSKLSRIKEGFNREYYESMLNFYNYLVELKKQRETEQYLKEKIKEEKNVIETDPILREMEEIMKKELEKIESEGKEEENIENNYSIDDESTFW